jgi:hypothetical protein
MAAFLYRCPKTGLRVQGWLVDEPAQHGEHYKLVNCLACGGHHLVNTATGKTLAEEDESAASTKASYS